VTGPQNKMFIKNQLTLMYSKKGRAIDKGKGVQEKLKEKVHEKKSY
jgi:hypothetical protein